MTPSPTQAAAVSPSDASARAGLVEDTVRVTIPAPRRVRLADIRTSLPVGLMLGRRDIKIKYKQSALGPLWLVLQPLGMLAAVSVAFSTVTNVNTGDVPYVVFALVGLAVWTYVQMTITVAPQVLPSNWQVVKRSPCPRVAFVTGTLISVLPPLGVVLVAAIGAAAISGHLGIEAFAMPVLIVWLVALMWGVTLLVTAIGARFRDAVALAPVVVQAGLFLTPFGYPLTQVPDTLAKILSFNPASGVIEAWRWSLLGMAPDGFAIVVGLVETVVFALLGWYVFGRRGTRFSDYV
jgi:ABC-type polysaccharide/polyol phosphate export permease